MNVLYLKSKLIQLKEIHYDYKFILKNTLRIYDKRLN